MEAETDARTKVMWVTPLKESVAYRLEALAEREPGVLDVVVVPPASCDELRASAARLDAHVVVLYAAPGVDKVVFAANVNARVYRPDYSYVKQSPVFDGFRRIDPADIVACLGDR